VPQVGCRWPDHPGFAQEGRECIHEGLRRQGFPGCAAYDCFGADLATGLFLTQSQLDAAQGDTTTRLPPPLTRPAHWSPPADGPTPMS
jgi:hypothetical protein